MSGDPPRLVLVLQLEELLRVRVDALSAEDEFRLRTWLEKDAVRRRLFASIEDALDELGIAA